MTDGERARIVEAFKTFQVATVKVRDGCAAQLVFGAVCAAMGWVLDEPVYRDNFEDMLRNLRARGVILKPESTNEGK